jgi:hypothetical protein
VTAALCRAVFGCSGWTFTLLTLLCVLADMAIGMQLAAWGKSLLRWGDEVGGAGFGLVSPPLARHALRVFERWGARLLAVPWALFGVGLLVHRVRWWAPALLVAWLWLRMRQRRY